ncbi:MAG: RagB/SusD family nutrient uptake outer membrane protein [Prolixibacteraceae bacterium]
MKILLKYTFVASIAFFVSACSLIEPVDENLLGEDRLNYDPAFAEGVLLNAYEGMVNQLSFNDAATDDAVNNYMSGYRRMATGEWDAQNTFTSRWWQYEYVLYTNKFISILDNVVWKWDEESNQLFRDRMYGEALAMRALRHFWILQEHGGKVSSGELMGIPYIKEFLSPEDNFNLPRLSFQETMDAINQDFDEALTYLPMDYDGVYENRPDRYENADKDRYEFAFGATQDLRISGRIIKAFKAKLFLLAASPAFFNGEGAYYEKAATILGDLLIYNKGIAGLHPTGHYDFYEFRIGLKKFPEVVWRDNTSPYHTWVTRQNFPPSLNGEGRMNPSQNLVDAFPMLDGKPFSVNHPDYNPAKPFENRDPRLSLYILYNGNDLSGRVIKTGVGGGNDELDKVPSRSTRSGYYMKKLIDQRITISSDGSISASEGINVFLRYTDLYLMLAEAANEIGGPDYMVGGMSARTILAAIRKRAGLALSSGDAYLQGIGNKNDMREIVRNERRLELCFEGHRLYDLRRWNILDKIDDIKGVKYDGTNYIPFDVEPRVYPSNANYAPIPQSEIVKFDALEQNVGW